MSFNYPYGLLVLIAIPVLVIIYIIKNRYTEQVIASTYLWTLSEKFLKRKNPINRISGIISLMLQILTVAMIALALAQPVITLPGAAYDYMIIIDGSGSMNISSNGETRLDRAVDRAESIIKSSSGGSTYTIVFATDTAEVICEAIDNKTDALSRLGSITPAYGTMGRDAAAAKAQEAFNENSSIKIYFITDKNYESTQNVEVINVGSNEINYSVSDLAYTTGSTGITVTANVWSYTGGATLNVALYVDGSETAADTQTVEVAELEAGSVSLSYNALVFDSLRVVILNDDGLAEDNETILYNALSDSTYSVLLVSDSSFFLETLSLLGNVQVDVVATSDYYGTTGYGLYVFDNYSPDVLPSDGAVWFVNPAASVANSNFTVQSSVDLGDGGGVMTYSSSTSTRVKELLSGTTGDDIYIKQYVKCGFSGNFYTLLSYSGDPLLFAGTNAYGNREVVFAFDLHDSDITITPDYVILLYNLLAYTYPEIVSQTSFTCGETVTVNVLSGCDSIRVDTPSGKTSYLDTGSDYAEYELEEVGTYTITVTISGSARQVLLYSALSADESYVTATADYFYVQGEAGTESRDGVYDDLLYLFIILAVLFIADWGVYCYEQYQLR